MVLPNLEIHHYKDNLNPESGLNMLLKTELDSPLTPEEERSVQDLFLSDLYERSQEGQHEGVMTTLHHELAVAHFIATLPLDTDIQRAVVAGALSHDTGKIDGKSTPNLQYKRLFNSNEYENMTNHPLNSVAKIKLHNLPQIIIDMAEKHHENADGTGYPRKLKIDQIPISAQLMQIVDILEAATAPSELRKYNGEGKQIAMVVTELRTRINKNGYNPVLLQALSSLFERFAGSDNLTAAREKSAEILNGWLDNSFNPTKDNLIDQIINSTHASTFG